MTRDRLLALLKELECAAEAYNDGYSCAELKSAIDWLEKPDARFDVTVGEVLDDLFGPAK
jgi:hypothetical protein